ncbi:alpha/beta fold hydrolase [Streptomyces hainanensis]|uniref:Alpha/beta hydrolase n=1 Tax=Streptomyces hainanensis TaxID=402648 RepID=A0A4R4SWN9_9ACTN|nr:alpha/beta hydrolase [Streptomyces hainanensis]TDC67676.1 alpha/beta hydrolase [Streptomyces hainanensis]
MSWARRAGIAGVALGAVATTVAVERLSVQRSLRRQARLALDTAGPFGTLRGTPGTTFAEDGTELYYEIDEPADHPTPAAEPAVGPPPTPGRLTRLLRRHGPASRRPTVVFSHGYCLAQDVWHFQRAALRGQFRAVYWDQRSHGRSARGTSQVERVEDVSIDQLGRDLKAVLDATVPEGPVILVGHSMGGMTVMALAEQYPEYVAERVTGIAFLGTSAGGLIDVTYGFPAPVINAVRRAVPGMLRMLGTRPELVERGRRAVGDLYSGLVRKYSFGEPASIDPAVARFAERLIEAVPMDVVAEFYPAFHKHDKWAALGVLRGLEEDLPVLVLAGDRDEMTPPSHSQRIAEELPAAELLLVPDTGHLVLLEAPVVVNEALVRLLTRSIHPHEPAV